MFNYWSAPPILLRAWACPKEPSPAVDRRFRFGSPAGIAGEKGHAGSRLSRIGWHVRDVLFSRATDADPRCRLAEPGL